MTQILNVDKCRPIMTEINIGGFCFTADAHCHVWLHRGPASLIEADEKGQWSNPSCGVSTAGRDLLKQVTRENGRFNLPCMKLIYHRTATGHQQVWADELNNLISEDNPLLQVISVMEVEGESLKDLEKHHLNELMATPEYQNMVLRVRAQLSQIKSVVKKARPDKRRECAHNEIKLAAEKMTRKFHISQAEVLTLLSEIIDEMNVEASK